MIVGMIRDFYSKPKIHFSQCYFCLAIVWLRVLLFIHLPVPSLMYCKSLNYVKNNLHGCGCVYISMAQRVTGLILNFWNYFSWSEYAKNMRFNVVMVSKMHRLYTEYTFQCVPLNNRLWQRYEFRLYWFIRMEEG